ncbi:MAG TPA: hypothetical protein VG328_09030 [Stellaceae bacterium]|nr:hypothetical protein [Stellaceae bacterium]
MAQDKAKAIREHLESLPLYGGRGGDQYYFTESDLRPLAAVQSDASMGQYTPEQLLATPHLVDFLNDPAIVDFVQLALGCVPTLYSVRAWWSFVADTPTGLNQQYFHRDTDDWRFVTLFLYLTDVDKESGPHQLIGGTQTLGGMQRLIELARARGVNDIPIDAEESFSQFFGVDFSANCERLFSDSVMNIEGTAGTMFLANTLALHRGLLPAKKPRLILWARYGLGPNSNNVALENGPVRRSSVVTQLPDTLRNRYVNRLLFDFDDRADHSSNGTAGASGPAAQNGFDKDARIKELEHSLAAADDLLVARDLEIARDATVAQLRHELQAIRSSTTWRATAFLRNAVDFLRQNR